MNLIGSVLAGRYEIVEEVGSGGMAIVYKAKCRILNRYVAIKVLRNDLKDDGEFIRRFNIEAQSAASLTHPNIVSIYDVGTDGDIHYIVMELVEGNTLKEYIDKNGTLNWSEAIGYAIQIASGLEQAHNNSIVHRDIKPHNIIMASDGVLKITDFGIARASAQSTVNCEDTAIGSVHYVSPEQARGGYVDERSDIYSLGVVLYEMLTGKVPFDNESPVSIALMHLQSAPTPPRELNLSIPKAVEEIVLKAMNKEVSGRYKTITQMKQELISCKEALLSSSAPSKATETDELGGTAIFTPARDILETEDIIYTNNQTPSASSNLVPKTEASVDTVDTEIVDFDNNEEEIIVTAKSKKKKSNGKIAAIAVALVAALGIIIFLFSLVGDFFGEYLFSGKDKVIRIPQFVNRQYDDVIDEYGDSEYFEFTVKYTEDEDEDDGFVLQQNPAPETDVSFKNDKISVTLTVNRIEKVSASELLEDYVGEDYNDIKDELDELGISVKLKYEYDDSYNEDYVIDQSETAGTKLSKIKKLTLTLSKGPEKTTEEPDDRKDPEETNTDTPNTNEETVNKPANRKRLTIYGPTNKNSAHVEVKVNGKVLKSMEMTKGSSDVVTIQSTLSTATVEVFHDGVLVLTQTINMTD